MSDELPPPDPRDVALRELLYASTLAADRLEFLFAMVLRSQGSGPRAHDFAENHLRPIHEALTRARAAIEEIGT